MSENHETAIRPEGHDPFAGPALLLSAPSTESQREIWTSVQMGDPASLAFNESITLGFRGKLDLEALRGAVHQLIERHESLRMTFSEDGASLFVSVFPSLPIPLIDISTLGPAERTAEMPKLFAAEVETPFELLQGRLIRARIVKLKVDEHILIMTCHHIVCDGWSFGVMLHELGALYEAARRKIPAGLEPAPSFSRFSLDCEARAALPAFAKARSYWLGQFEGTLPVLDLPTDRPRPPFKTYNSRREDYPLSAELVQSVRKTGAKAGCSLVHTLMAGFNVLLHRICAQNDLIVGLPASGQAAADLRGLVGHAVNTLPIRSQLEGEQKFSEYLRALKRTMLDAFDHQEFTYSSLLQKIKVPRDPSRLPLVSVLFNVDQKLDANKLGFQDVEVEFRSNPRHYENFELFINAVENRGQLILEVQYNRDLFDGETVRRWMAMFETLLEGITRAPDGKIAELPLIPLAEQSRILVEWNSTAADYPRQLTVSELFQAQARRTPNRIAARFDDSRLTYRELDQRSNQLARRLRGLGVEKGTLVGIAVERSLDMLVCMLGVLKAGGGYVPLDPAYPKDRLAFMLEHSGLPVLLTQSHLVNELPALPGQPGKILLIDTNHDEIVQQSVEPLPQLADPESVAYVIYTSGSTGKPKGVMVPHRAVVNFLTSMGRKPGITESDVLVAVTTLSFDIAVLELYLPLTVGAQVVIASRDTAADGNALRDLLHSSGATFMQATPATWRILLEVGWKGSRKAGEMFKVLAGGEAVPRDLINQLLDHTDTVWNMYGPTETAVWSTCQPIRARTGAVSIGRPIDNTQVYILDTRLKPMPIGVAGELHIGGSGVTHGYLHRPDLTAERFIDNPFFDPFSADLHAKLYKTGDLARLMADGTIEYVGRNDSQVKVRGYRIELGEIETVLAQHPNVAQNVVMVREDRPGDVRLVAYAIAKPGLALELNDVRTHLRASLPEYMIPQNLVVLEAFPRTNNGKIERKALPAPAVDGGGAGATDDEFVAPRTPAEILLAELWRELIRTERVGVHDNFFNLGGHSLLSIQFISRLEKKTGIRLNPRVLLLNSLEQIALQIKVEGDDGQKAAGAGAGAAGAATSGTSAGLLGAVSLLKSSLFGTRPAPAEESALTAIPLRKTTGPAAASLMQEQLWELDQQSPGSTVYNLPAAFRLQGELDIPAMQRALGELLRRHEVLRGTLEKSRRTLNQVIAPPREIPLVPIDLSSVPEAGREAKIVDLLMAEAALPFDLGRGPLVRAQLYKLSPQEHVLFFMPHHAVWDGWSFDLFLREMDTLYDAFRNGKPSPLKELPFQYSDYAEWHRAHVKGKGLDRERGYWLRQLSGQLPVLKLPTDRPRPPVISFRGAMHEVKFPKPMMDALTELGRSEGATLNLVLLAAFTAFLFRRSGQRDLTIGVPVQGRSAPGVQDLIGYFVNTLVVRTRLPESAPSSFREVLRRVQESQMDAFDHQEMPFELLVRELELPKDPSRTPLYQAGFSFQDALQRRTQFSNLKLGQFHLHPKGVPTDLTLWFKATPNGLTGAFEYSTDLFDASTMEAFSHELEALLKAILANPDQSIFKKTEPAPSAPAPAPARPVSPAAPLLKTARVLNKPLNPFFFKSGGKRLFGIFHPPRPQNARDTAVLICNPMGQEYLRSHWALRQLTTNLVKAGFPVLRFDYHATGDSEGESTEISLAQWMTDVRAAASELQTASGARKLSLVGLRLGAALAARTAEGLALRDLVLWDPVVSGRRYLDDLTGLHSRLLTGGPYHQNLTPAEIAATEQLMGFPVPLAFRGEIEKIDLSASAPVKAERAWIFASTERDEYPRLQAAEFHPALDYRLVPDGGDWDNLADAHGSLLAPRIVQAIVTAMSGGKT